MSLIDDAEEFVKRTQQGGGATWNISEGFIPVGSQVKRPEMNKFMVGGVTNPSTGSRFPTEHVVSASQFTPARAAEHMIKTAILTDGKGHSGSWVNQYEGDRVDLDVSEGFNKKRDARMVAEERREDATFETRTFKEHLTSHGKAKRNAAIAKKA